MADNFNYLDGETNPIAMLADTSFPIHIGDLIFQDPSSKKARSAASMVDQGSETLDQQAFHDQFVGVALQRGGELESGEVSFNLNPLPGQIIIATAGDFAFACAATTFAPGDLVGGKRNAGNTSLMPQNVAKVSAVANSIGVAVPEPNALGNSRTSVRVRIKSSLFGGIPSIVVGSSSGTL